MVSVFLKTIAPIIAAFIMTALLVNNSGLLNADIAAPFASITASLFDRFGGEPATSANHSTPLVQRTAVVETLTPADRQQRAPNNIAASTPTEPVVENV